MSNNPSQQPPSRRNVLKTGIAGLLGLGLAKATTGSGSPAFADETVATGRTGYVARVVRLDGRMAVVVPLPLNKGGAGRPPISLLHTSFPLVGFPDHVVPRTGDLVTVTEDPQEQLAALPVCAWVTGVPRLLPSGEYEIAGQRTTADSIVGHLSTGTVSACLLGTQLSSAQVLSVRAA